MIGNIRIRIGKGSIIAANAMVIENVPDNVMIAGIPAIIQNISKQI